MKICYGCRYYLFAPSDKHQCLHPYAKDIDCVTGEPIAIFCRTLRADRDRCGPAGVWWEEKEAPDS